MAGRPPPEVTLRDVARVAGVSRATASRVLGGRGPASAAARDRVTAAARVLRYVPDPAARALVTGGGVRLAVAVTGGTPEVLHDPYVAALRETGVDVPGDVAVVGFDDIDAAALSEPGLTTTSNPVERIVTGAAVAVLDRRPPPPATLFPSVLVRRSSS